MTTYLGILIASFLITYFATPVIQALALRVGALDLPSERKIHSRVTPRLGGLAVFIGFWAAFLLGLGVNDKFREAFLEPIWGIFLGSLLLVVIGVYDDIKGASPQLKFPFQVTAALIAFYFGIRFMLLSDIFHIFTSEPSVFKLTYWTSLFFTLLWIVGITNAMNFVDGIDALAGGLSFIAAVTLFIVALNLEQYFFASLYVALIGATAGFGNYNKYPAKIFLGDTGSTFLGFVLACVSVLACHKSTALGSLLIPIVALGIPISDTGYAVIRRYLLGRSLFKADKGHLHHRLLEMGYTPKEVVWIIYILSIALSLGVFFLINAHSEFASLVVGMMTIAALLVASKLRLLDFEAWSKPLDSQKENPKDHSKGDSCGEGE